MLNKIKNKLGYLFLFLPVLLLYFIFITYTQRAIGVQKRKSLSNINLISLNGEREKLYNIKANDKYTVVLLVESRCDNCHSYVSSLFKDELNKEVVDIIILSTEDYTTIDKEYIYSLVNTTNSKFYFVDAKEFLVNFGSIKVPQLLVYNPNLEFNEEFSKILPFKNRFKVNSHHH